MAKISVTCTFVTFLVNFDTHTLEDLGLGDLLRGLGEAEADLDLCDRLYRSLERELELLLSLDDGLGLLLLLLLRLLALVSTAGVAAVGAVAGGTDASVVAVVLTAVVSIFLSGDGSTEIGGLLVFFVTVGLEAVVCLGRTSLFVGVDTLALALDLDEAEVEEDQDEDRDEEEEPERDRDPLLELLSEELMAEGGEP